MIHSLAGGKIRYLEYADFVKVRFNNQDEIKVCWFLTDIIDLTTGDKVIVSTPTNSEVVGVVEKIERNLSSQLAPIPIKRAKYIIKKITNNQPIKLDLNNN